jgi:hypothetical protein
VYIVYRHFDVHLGHHHQGLRREVGLLKPAFGGLRRRRSFSPLLPTSTPPPEPAEGVLEEGQPAFLLLLSLPKAGLRSPTSLLRP